MKVAKSSLFAVSAFLCFTVVLMTILPAADAEPPVHAVNKIHFKPTMKPALISYDEWAAGSPDARALYLRELRNLVLELDHMDGKNKIRWLQYQNASRRSPSVNEMYARIFYEFLPPASAAEVFSSPRESRSDREVVPYGACEVSESSFAADMKNYCSDVLQTAHDTNAQLTEDEPCLTGGNFSTTHLSNVYNPETKTTTGFGTARK